MIAHSPPRTRTSCAQLDCSLSLLTDQEHLTASCVWSMPQSTTIIESDGRQVRLDLLSRTRQALQSQPPDDPDGAAFLIDLGDSLKTHFEQLRDTDAL
jgi:hypothetical protein